MTVTRKIDMDGGGMSEYTAPTLNELPPGWKLIQVSKTDFDYYNPKRDLRVLLSIDTRHETNGDWLHVSYSHQKKIPNYDTTTYVRRHFIGESRECINVFPPKDRYVNIHPNCLHLWCPLDPRDITWPKFEKYFEDIGFLI